MIYFNSKTPKWTPLSNMWVEPFNVRILSKDVTVTSAEAAYQASKSQTLSEALLLAQLSPFQARKCSKQIALRPNWNLVKNLVMATILEDKFTQCPAARGCLWGTEDRHLYHLSPWDTYWGVDNSGYGGNLLGHMLMNLRAWLYWRE